MINLIGHSGGRIVFATQSPDFYDFAAPDGMTIVEVAAETYAQVSPTVGQLKFRVDGKKFISIPDQPSEYHVWDWPSLTWIQDRALAEKAVRAKRAMLLAASDWTQLPDVPLETKAAWATNRQALRDITEQDGFPFDVIWPLAPQQ